MQVAYVLADGLSLIRPCVSQLSTLTSLEHCEPSPSHIHSLLCKEKTFINILWQTVRGPIELNGRPFHVTHLDFSGEVCIKYGYMSTCTEFRFAL